MDRISRLILIVMCLWTVLFSGCDPSSESSQSESSLPVKEVKRTSVASRSSQDDSLYQQILETMQQENQGLKQQIQEAMDKCAELEKSLSEIKLERDVAFKAYLKVSDSINALKTDASSKDRRIRELEQENQSQQETITQLNQQLAQLVQAMNESGTSTTNLNGSTDPNMNQ